MTLTLLLALTASTLMLAGLSWTIQVVHYPLFAAVGPDLFPAYQRQHSARITALVTPLWIVQGLATGLLLLRADVPRGLMLAAAVAAATTVVVTVAASVPAHSRLAEAFEPHAHRRLVRTNWLRTIAWSLNGGLALWLLVLHLRDVA